MSETSNPVIDNGNPEVNRDIIPHDTSSLDPTTKTERVWYKRTAAKVGAGALVVVAGSAAVFGMMLPKVDTVKTAPEVSGIPAASAPATPGESQTTTTPEKLLTVASLELPALLTPEQLGSTIYQKRITQWISSGQTDANRLAWIKNTLPEGEFIRNTITDKIGDTYADALLVSNWRDIPELKNWVDLQKTNHVASLELWFKTYKSGLSEDVEPYKSGSTVNLTTVVGPQDPVTLSIAITATEYDNASENRAVTLDPSVATINGNKFITNTTLKLIDGTWKISTLNSLSLNNSN